MSMQFPQKVVKRESASERCSYRKKSWDIPYRNCTKLSSAELRPGMYQDFRHVPGLLPVTVHPLCWCVPCILWCTFKMYQMSMLFQQIHLHKFFSSHVIFSKVIIQHDSHLPHCRICSPSYPITLSSLIKHLKF